MGLQNLTFPLLGGAIGTQMTSPGTWPIINQFSAASRFSLVEGWITVDVGVEHVLRPDGHRSTFVVFR